MILAVETSGQILDSYFYAPPFHGLRMKIKNDYAQSKSNHYDVLIFGDCYLLHGANPSVIEENTHLTVFNFATHSSQTILSTRFLLENYLKSSRKTPPYIVIDYLPMVLKQTKQDVIQNYQFYLYDFKKGNMLKIMDHLGVFQTFKFLIPSIKHQEFLTHLTILPNPNEIREFHNTVINKEKGYFPWKTGEIYNGTAEDQNVLEPFSVSSFFDENIHEILNLAREKNIQLIYVIPSRPSDWHALEQKYHVTDMYFSYLQSVQKNYPNMTIVSPQDELEDKILYADNTHLNQDGAVTLSRFISEKINQLKKEK